MLVPLTSLGLLQALQEMTCVRRDAQEVGGLLEGVVVGAGHQDRVAAPGGDLNRGAVGVDLLNQGNRFLRASLAVTAITTVLLVRLFVQV